MIKERNMILWDVMRNINVKEEIIERKSTFIVVVIIIIIIIMRNVA